MKKLNLKFDQILCYQYEKHKDLRGYFIESFNKLEIKKNFGLDINCFQQNIVFSKNNVLRGLHYQKGSKSQGKLISVIEGKILDVVVDIRKNSKTFGKWIFIELSKSNRKILWVPKGFAHGYYTLSDYNLVNYLVDKPYYPEFQRSIKWNDEKLNIKWPFKKNPILSLNDKIAKSFSELF